MKPTRVPNPFLLLVALTLLAATARGQSAAGLDGQRETERVERAVKRERLYLDTLSTGQWRARSFAWARLQRTPDGNAQIRDHKKITDLQVKGSSVTREAGVWHIAVGRKLKRVKLVTNADHNKRRAVVCRVAGLDPGHSVDLGLFQIEGGFYCFARPTGSRMEPKRR